MPGFDRTGPQGQGSRTGRQMGKCVTPKTNTEKEKPTEDTHPRGTRGSGRGLGRRLGFGRRLD